ncbi:OmpA family protein [Paraburkholderia heleia]|uniref:OmpA family protein n=1 Tax=Paraburkholderia heleia TaxID=634127 RepID=UPI002AB6315F|nr:OmpA family protein [Paraburkholderia heleia]
MKHIDLARTLNSTFSQPLLEQLSGKFGLSPEILRRVVDRAAPALVAALMASGASEQGATAVFAAIMSPPVNARIAEQCRELAVTTTGLKALEETGQSFVREGMRVGPGDLSDFVAANSGVPTQAAYAMTSVIAAILAGLLKHHVLLEQGAMSGLLQLLAGQWPSIESQFTDSFAHVLRFDDAAAFRDTIPAQLRVLAGSFERATARPVAQMEGESEPRRAADELPSVNRQPTSSPHRRVMIGLFLLAVFAVAIGYGAYFFQKPWPAGAVVHEQSAQIALPPAASKASDPMKDAIAPASAPLAVGSGTSETAVSGQVDVSPPSASSSTAPEARPASSSSVASQALPEKNAHRDRLQFGVNRVGATILSATVSSVSEKSRLLEVLEMGLGAGHYIADVTVDPQAASADWLPEIGALLPLMHVARADMTIDGQRIELGGGAAEPGSGWVSRIRNTFGSRYSVTVFDADGVVSAATVAYKTAIDNQLKSGSCDSVDRVLNLQVIDFARGSGHIPATAVGNLTEAAQLLKACAARGQKIVLTIQSFSDNIGDPKANLDLSVKRADAVRAYLVRAGVPADSLSSQGHGVVQPITDNVTERGRFANRRIVFAARP